MVIGQQPFADRYSRHTPTPTRAPWRPRDEPQLSSAPPAPCRPARFGIGARRSQIAAVPRHSSSGARTEPRRQACAIRNIGRPPAARLSTARPPTGASMGCPAATASCNDGTLQLHADHLGAAGVPSAIPPMKPPPPVAAGCSSGRRRPVQTHGQRCLRRPAQRHGRQA